MNKESKSEIWLDRLSKLAAIATSVSLVIIALVTLRINCTSFVYDFRPYIGISNLDTPPGSLQEKFTIEVTLHNTGRVPAQNLKSKIDKTTPLMKKMQILEGGTRPGIIFPNNQVKYDITFVIPSDLVIAIKDKKIFFDIHLIYTYGGLDSHGYLTEYFYRYNPVDNYFGIIDGKVR